MDQALRRFTALIEALAGAGPAGLALGELAGRCALPPATCSRALKAMARLGWADQAGNRGNYRFGPRATAMSAAASYRGRLLEFAVPRLRRLARRHPGTGVSVVTLREGQRFGLWMQGPEPGAQSRLELVANADVWGMPSGRLLIALCPARARRRWIARLGLPDPAVWAGIGSTCELDEALAGIRRERIAQVVRGGQVYVAVPVEDGAGDVILGCWRRGTRADPALLRGLRSAAAAVAEGLRSG